MNMIAINLMVYLNKIKFYSLAGNICLLLVYLIYISIYGFFLYHVSFLDFD